jgi:pimeloyl-ACP methyl ester carboxylesterase
MHTLVTLGAREQSAIAEHLLGMGDADRYDRFLNPAGDDAVEHYVHNIGFARDILLGVTEGGAVLALAHVAMALDHGELVAEVGISVDSRLRRQGLGKHLLQGALEAATRCGVARLEVMFRSRNQAMAGLTRSLGGLIVRDGADSRAAFALNPLRGLPIVAEQSSTGQEQLSARHPRERGRALLVHGAGGDSYTWLSRVVPALWAAGYSVLAPTLPGHGRRAQPDAAQLDDLQRCVDEAAAGFEPTLIVGHDLGGYLVQRHLQSAPVSRAVLLASMPAEVPRDTVLDETLGRIACPLARESARTALTDAPDLAPLSLRELAVNNVQVFGGLSDPLVPGDWVHRTAERYGVHPQFVAGGHRLMVGQSANEWIHRLAA